MQPEYSINRSWSDKFILEIKKIIGGLIVVQSTWEQDTQQAADLVVLSANNLKIACRVRRNGYLERYKYEFTIRSHVFSGAKTEMAKILEGFGDWMFYGHADGEQIGTWMIIDLNKFRTFLLKQSYIQGWNRFTQCKKNKDGTTGFFAFDIRDFKDALIASNNLEFDNENQLIAV